MRSKRLDRHGPDDRSLDVSDRGAVTAEFALLLPVVIGVLALVLGAIVLSAEKIAITSAAGELARLEARGDTDAARAIASRVPHHAEIHRAERGPLHCVTLRTGLSRGPLRALSVHVESCAARIEGEL
jgi:hypothetical protein